MSSVLQGRTQPRRPHPPGPCTRWRRPALHSPEPPGVKGLVLCMGAASSPAPLGQGSELQLCITAWEQSCVSRPFSCPKRPPLSQGKQHYYQSAQGDFKVLLPRVGAIRSKGRRWLENSGSSWPQPWACRPPGPGKGIRHEHPQPAFPNPGTSTFLTTLEVTTGGIRTSPQVNTVPLLGPNTTGVTGASFPQPRALHSSTLRFIK